MPTVEEATKEGDFARVTMRFRFIDADTGESIESVFLGEGQDKGDKAFYKAYTGAVKYVLMKTFLVATGDDPEADEQPNDKSLKAPEKVIESPPSNEPAMDRTKAALLKTINTVTTKKGLADRKEIHRLAGEVCGREIKSLNDCTPDELKKLLTFFNKGVA
jgi:hypothetical protein